jgi:hypothetical protein
VTGCSCKPQPEHHLDHKTNPSSSLANQQGDVRHRLEAVAQRALSFSDSVAPAATAPTSTTARADGSHGTSTRGAPAAGSTSSELAPPEPEAVSRSSDPSPLSLQSPSTSHEASQPQVESSQSGIWRSQTPFETQPPRSTGPHVSLSVSPRHLSEPQAPHLDNQGRSTDLEHLPSIGESSEGSARRSSIYFEGHINDNQPPPRQHHHLRSICPFVQAIMAFEKGRKFSTGTSVHRRRKMSTLVEKEGAFGPALTVCSCSLPHQTTPPVVKSAMPFVDLWIDFVPRYLGCVLG